MNILYLCTFYHTAMIFRDAMNHLEAKGHHVLAFNPVAKGTVVDGKYKSIMDDKVIHEECFRRIDRYFYFLKQWKIYRRLIARIDVTQFDVLHSHTLFNGGWVALNLYKKSGIPYIVSVRNTDINTFLKFPIFFPIAKTIVRHAKGVVFLSEKYREAFAKKLFRNNLEKREALLRKSRVVPNGLEVFWLGNINSPKTLRDGCLNLLFVGDICRNKNLQATLAAMRILVARNRAVKFTVVGKKVDDAIWRNLDNNPNVQLVEQQPKERLLNYYRTHDILIMPSLTETFGRVYAEAMSQGVPIIYTRGQGFDGFFPEGEVGYSVDPHDPEEIADRVEDIVNDYNVMSCNCLRNCRRFDWNIIAENLIDLYRSSTVHENF